MFSIKFKGINLDAIDLGGLLLLISYCAAIMLTMDGKAHFCGGACLCVLPTYPSGRIDSFQYTFVTMILFFSLSGCILCCSTECK